MSHKFPLYFSSGCWVQGTQNLGVGERGGSNRVNTNRGCYLGKRHGFSRNTADLSNHHSEYVWRRLLFQKFQDVLGHSEV